MSEKLKEFAEWPQERLADSKQVRVLSRLITGRSAHPLIVPPSLHKALPEGYVLPCISQLTSTDSFRRVSPDLPGRCRRLCHYGLHRVPREAHSHPNVRSCAI